MPIIIPPRRSLSLNSRFVEKFECPRAFDPGPLRMGSRIPHSSYTPGLACHGHSRSSSSCLWVPEVISQPLPLRVFVFRNDPSPFQTVAVDHESPLPPPPRHPEIIQSIRRIRARSREPRPAGRPQAQYPRITIATNPGVLSLFV